MRICTLACRVKRGFILKMRVKGISFCLLGFIVTYSGGFVILLLRLVNLHPETSEIVRTAAIGLAGILYLAGCYIATELASKSILRRVHPSLLKESAQPALQMMPHVFTHFIPCNSYADVKDHFRLAARADRSKVGKIVYLAGDCTIFEEHLDVHESMAFQLNDQLCDWSMLNAGAPHYSILHAYNRLVFDVSRGYKPDMVLLFSAANDVLGFIHHKDGFIDDAHTHMYRPWLPYGGVSNRFGRIPSSSLKLLFAYFIIDRRDCAWNNLAESTSDVFFEEDSVRTARDLFNTSTYSRCLGLFLSTCRAIDAEFVPTTFYYNNLDMQNEPRRTYAWGIDQINDLVINFSQANGIRFVDFAKRLDLVPERDIHNKWHYTPDGNRKRALLLKDELASSVGLKIGSY